MDDGFIDENTKVDTEAKKLSLCWTKNYRIVFYRGLYDISDVLAKSSNIGTAKLITNAYSKNPQIFLTIWSVGKCLTIDVGIGPGETFITTPKSKRWNKATLASLFGYTCSDY